MLRENKTYLVVICFALMFLSCDRIKRKGKHVYKTTETTLKEKKDELSDRIFARFDASTPDTKYNKRRFTEFFGFSPGTDVSNLYCHADEFGIDASYWFSFRCHDSTAQKIIRELNLKPAKPIIVTSPGSEKLSDSIPAKGGGLGGGLNSQPTSWWDTAFINKTVPYYKEKGQLYWYLWYDSENHTVFFLTFDT